MARETGILVDWHDTRGFGFIQRPAGGKIYVHMKSIGKSVERPKVGDSLSYEIGKGMGGRPAAINVHNQGTPARQPAQAPAPAPDISNKPARARGEPGLMSISIRVAAAAVILVLLANNIMLERFPVWVGVLYLIAGIASFVFYQSDKRAAARREWREPERRLHLLDLTFGIIGGLLAQHVLRHKTYKPGFVTVTALITALHVLTLGLIMFGVYAPGSVGDFFRQFFRG
ncbi:MAG: DUF1294 domain-containing protein [Hyphomonadaceae bacterium]|nr:DUF1294 domain-containing protein [Hyphomonadaceae bacterium]